MNDTSSRRPLKTRDKKIMKSIAGKISRMNITPNQISVMSVFFAGFSGICFLLFGRYQQWWLPILSAVFIQCRLLCNLFDGMVAVEGGKSTPAGELYNDFPDRIADLLIIVPAGYAISVVNWGMEIGWCAGAMALMTAYTRTLSSSVGAPVDFRGPMAKQHRMALLTFTCIACAVETLMRTTHYSLVVALVLIVIGGAVTCLRRVIAAYQFLEKSAE